MKIVVLLILSMLTLPFIAHAENETPTKTTPAATEVPVFEIIDGTGQAVGEPGPTTETARAKWKLACGEWTTETKNLNKKNELLSISCNEPSCAYQENGSYICSSTATYKVKIAGRLAPPPPTPAPQKAETIIQTPPPQVVYEVTPAPQPGFVWITGYWGWQGSRHVWYPGHWVPQQPGQIWIGHQWVHSGPGWHFESGHWGHR